MMQHSNKRGFASDNNAGVHPDILKGIIDSNEGHVVGYGDDHYTRQARELFRNHLGEDAEVWFVFTGTAANTLDSVELQDRGIRLSLLILLTFSRMNAGLPKNSPAARF